MTLTIRRRMFLGVVIIMTLSLGNLILQFWAESTRSKSIDRLTGAQQASLLAQQIDDQLASVQLMHDGLVGLGDDATSDEVELLIDEVDTLESLFVQLEAVTERLPDEAATSVILPVVDGGARLIYGWLTYARAVPRGSIDAMVAHANDVIPPQSEVTTALANLRSNAQDIQQTAQQNFDEVTGLIEKFSTIIFSGSTAVIILLVLIFSRNLTTRLAHLRQGAERIGRGELDHTIGKGPDDELGKLAATFNEMSSRLRDARSELTGANDALAEQFEESIQQREKAQGLLLNILPAATAEELTEKGSVIPHYFRDSSVIFADISGFTLSSEKLAADELVHLLHHYFTEFDQIVDRYKVEKLKTIGDCYMAVGGVPDARASHAVDAVMACLELKHAVQQINDAGIGPGWTLRIGAHCGPVIAGVVGIRKFAFDIWGPTVNLASRMESSGEPGQVNISEAVYINIKDFFEVEARGAIMTKEKREIPMYFVTGIKPELLEGEGEIPAAFRHRYEVYFRSDPPSFPQFLLPADRQSSDETKNPDQSNPD